LFDVVAFWLNGRHNPSVTSVPSSTQPEQVAKAFAHTAQLVKHYENFTVVSLLLPRQLKQHFYNIYAFCRHADDLADEVADKNESLRLLNALKADVHRMYTGTPEQLIMVACQQTVRQFGIPADPFLKLIDAFEQDQRISRYETYDQLVDYCTRSADPVGHLVLYLCGYSDPERQHLSNLTCTGLQLANFWQDVGNDLSRGRIYLPLEDLRRFGVPESDILTRHFTPAFADLMRFEVDRAEALFKQGEALLPLVGRRVRTDIALYGRGGQAILQSIRQIGYNTLEHRPKISRATKLSLLFRYLLGF
jgi:squalene synthase HpnC